MTTKDLFKIALRYIEKGYNTEQLRYGDDLYNATREEKDDCLEIFWEIQREGTDWAYKELKKLENE